MGSIKPKTCYYYNWFFPNGRIERLQSQLSSNLPVDAFELGPLTAPPIYEYKGGLVYRRGYQLEIQLINQADNKILFRLSFFQGLLKKPTGWRQGDPDQKFRNEIPAGSEYFVEGDSERLEYNPIYGVEPPIALRISDEVFTDQNKLKILCKLNEGTLVEKLSAQLHIINCDQKIYSQNLELYKGQDWESYEVNPENWPVGDYSVELYPILSKTVWEEGPSVTYRHRKINQAGVPISPLSPWKLIRDTNRQALSITDFRQALQTWGDTEVDDSDWQFQTTTDGVSLISANTERANPLALTLRLQGYYAVFARVLNMGCLIQATDSEYVRAVKKPEIVTETFISACYFDTTSKMKVTLYKL